MGTWLVEQPEFDHIHITGSVQTGSAVKRAAGSKRVTSELGGVTAALVLPDVFSHREGMRHVARQASLWNAGEQRSALCQLSAHCYTRLLSPIF